MEYWPVLAGADQNHSWHWACVAVVSFVRATNCCPRALPDRCSVWVTHCATCSCCCRPWAAHWSLWRARYALPSWVVFHPRCCIYRPVWINECAALQCYIYIVRSITYISAVVDQTRRHLLVAFQRCAMQRSLALRILGIDVCSLLFIGVN